MIPKSHERLSHFFGFGYFFDFVFRLWLQKRLSLFFRLCLPNCTIQFFRLLPPTLFFRLWWIPPHITIDGGLVAAFFGARAGPGLALAPGPAAPAWPWHPGPRARTKKMQPPTHHLEGKSSTILQFLARVLTIPQTII